MTRRWNGGWRRVAAALGVVAFAQPAAAQQPPARASGIVAIGDNAVPLELRTAGDLAVMTVTLPDGRSAPYRAVATVDDAVEILADQRLAFAWPALLAWAGADLTALRDRALARAEQGDAIGVATASPRSQSERFAGDDAVTATLQHARALVRAGREGEAVALLRRRIAESHAADLSQHRDGFGTALFTIRLASILFDAGDEAAALATLDALSGDASIAPHYRLNIDVNRALLLAQAGRYAQALALINASLKTFRGDLPAADNQAIKIPDSEANFAWIEACALDGLGRHDEARARLAQIAPQVEGGTLTSTTQSARLSGFLCMHDAAGLAREIAADLAVAPPGGEIFARLQPLGWSRPVDQETIRRALAEPILVANLPSKARLLPPALQPAVAGWRAATGLDAGAARR